jgi:hypothetical protein
MARDRECGMWPFRRRRKIEAIRRTADHPGLPRLAHDVGHIIVVMLRDDDLSSLPGLYTKLFDIAHKHDALVEGVLSSLALITLDFSDETTAEVRRHKLVAELRDALGNDAKIIHGATERLHGLVGSSGHSCYGSFLPGFGASLRTLDQAGFGDVIAFK